MRKLICGLHHKHKEAPTELCYEYLKINMPYIVSTGRKDVYTLYRLYKVIYDTIQSSELKSYIFLYCLSFVGLCIGFRRGVYQGQRWLPSPEGRKCLPTTILHARSV